MELKSQFETKQETLKSNRKLLKELGPIRPTSSDDELQQKQDLDEENKVLIKDMTTLKKEYWTLFERLLGSSLIPDW